MKGALRRRPETRRSTPLPQDARYASADAVRRRVSFPVPGPEMCSNIRSLSASRYSPAQSHLVSVVPPRRPRTDRERACESHDRVFAIGVRETSRYDLESVGRGDVHDRSSASLDHSWVEMRGCSARRLRDRRTCSDPNPDRSLRADRETRLMPALLTNDVGRPKGGAGRVIHSGDRSRIGDVRRHEEYARPRLRAPARHSRACLGIDLRDDIRCPFRGEATYDRGSDAPTGSSDNRRSSHPTVLSCRST